VPIAFVIVEFRKRTSIGASFRHQGRKKNKILPPNGVVSTKAKCRKKVYPNFVETQGRTSFFFPTTTCAGNQSTRRKKVYSNFVETQGRTSFFSQQQLAPAIKAHAGKKFIRILSGPKAGNIFRPNNTPCWAIKAHAGKKLDFRFDGGPQEQKKFFSQTTRLGGKPNQTPDDKKRLPPFCWQTTHENLFPATQLANARTNKQTNKGHSPPVSAVFVFVLTAVK